MHATRPNCQLPLSLTVCIVSNSSTLCQLQPSASGCTSGHTVLLVAATRQHAHPNTGTMCAVFLYTKNNVCSVPLHKAQCVQCRSTLATAEQQDLLLLPLELLRIACQHGNTSMWQHHVVTEAHSCTAGVAEEQHNTQASSSTICSSQQQHTQQQHTQQLQCTTWPVAAYAVDIPAAAGLPHRP